MRQPSIQTITVLSRGLPKTGQEISYQTDDDGRYEAGWWLGRLNANNLTRFIVKSYVRGDVVIDLATKLMWARNGTGLGGAGGAKMNWDDCLSFCRLVQIGYFSNWRLPNLLEYCSLFNHSAWNPAIDSVFQNIIFIARYWSSTTRAFSTTWAKTISFSEGTTYANSKANVLHLLAVRSMI